MRHVMPNPLGNAEPPSVMPNGVRHLVGWCRVVGAQGRAPLPSPETLDVLLLRSATLDEAFSSVMPRLTRHPREGTEGRGPWTPAFAGVTSLGVASVLSVFSVSDRRFNAIAFERSNVETPTTTEAK